MKTQAKHKAKEKILRSFEDYTKEYFPKSKKMELDSARSPYNVGSQLADEALEKIQDILQKN